MTAESRDFDARRAKNAGDIVRVDRGIWGLKEWYPGRSFGKKDSAKAEGGEKGEANEGAERRIPPDNARQ